MSEPIPEPVPAPEGEPAPEPAPEGEPAAWAGPSQEEWQQTQAALGYIAQMLQPQGDQQQPQIDFLADNAQEQLDAYLAQRLSGYDAFQQQMALEAGEEEAQRLLGEIVQREGEFLLEGSAAKARALANDYFPAAAAQHGGANAQAAQAALEQAVKDVREWEQQVGKAYYERELNQIRGITGARKEPGVNQTGAASQLTVTPGGPNAVLRKWTSGERS